MKKNQIELTPGERNALEKFSTTGVHSVRLVKRAKIILALDTSNSRKASKQEEIAQHLEVSRQAVNNVRRDFLAAENVSIFLHARNV